MLSENLKKYRSVKGITQDTLARSASLPYNTVVKIEQGIIAEPRLGTLIKLADAIDVSLDELVGRKRKSHTKGQSGKPKV